MEDMTEKIDTHVVIKKEDISGVMRRNIKPIMITQNINDVKKMYEEIKSNNWKRMHGIPLKAKARSLYGGEIVLLNLDKYISKRSRKKQKKAHFRSCFNFVIEKNLCDNPNLKKIYYRYGYMHKKYRHKISNYKTGERTEIMIAEIMKSRYGDKNKQIICDHRGDNLDIMKKYAKKGFDIEILDLNNPNEELKS